MKIEKIRAMKIAYVGLSSTTRNNWVQKMMITMHPEMYPSFQNAYGQEWRKLCAEWAQKLTVGELIDFLDNQFQRHKDRMYFVSELDRSEKQFVDKLIQLGMTQLDWVVLPSSTVTIKMLKQLGKKKIGECSILVLGTLSSSALRSIKSAEERLDKKLLDFTIDDFLATPATAWRGEYGREFKDSVAKTRQKLIQIGFRYEDGIFLQEGTKRRLVEDLMEKEGLSCQAAKKVAEIAQKRCWVDRFLD